MYVYMYMYMPTTCTCVYVIAYSASDTQNSCTLPPGQKRKTSALGSCSNISSIRSGTSTAPPTKKSSTDHASRMLPETCMYVYYTQHNYVHVPCVCGALRIVM